MESFWVDRMITNVSLSLILFAFLFCIFTIAIIILKQIIDNCRRKKSHNYFKTNIININKKDKMGYIDIPKTKLELFNTDNIDALKDYIYDIFIKFENAYNNLDFNMMAILSTNELFQNYHIGINLDLKIGNKKIINNIERKNIIIYDLDSSTVMQTLSAMIEISYITYTLNRDGYVIKGNREKPITERFEVVFRKDFEKNQIRKCHNCGASVIGNKCDYCKSSISNVEFKISSIKKIIDK